jgi:hypothetical protein
MMMMMTMMMTAVSFVHRVMMCSDVVAAVVVVSLAFSPSLPFLYAAVFVQFTCSALFDPSRRCVTGGEDIINIVIIVIIIIVVVVVLGRRTFSWSPAVLGLREDDGRE